MARLFLLPGLLGAIVFVFWLWALFDVIMTDSILIRNMQKGTWVFLVIVLGAIGAAAWVMLGRPEGAGMAPGSPVTYDRNPHRQERRAIGREDASDWSGTSSGPSRPASSLDEESLAIRERRLMEREAELAKRERELGDEKGDGNGS